MEQTMVDRINIMLRRKGMSLRALSLESKVPYMTLNNLMKNGGDKAQLPTLKGIARCLGITLDALIDGPLDNETQKEKAPAQNEQELAEVDLQIINLLPFVPEKVKAGVVQILAATVDLAAAQESSGQYIREARALAAQADSDDMQQQQRG